MRSKAWPRPLAWLLVGMTLVTLSCQLLLGDEPRGEARPGVASDATAPPGPLDPCAHAYPPPRPTRDDDPTTARSYWFAADQLIIPLAPDAGVQPGFDLDQSCTCQADLHDGAPPCITPSGKGTSCDFDGGVDDAFGALALTYSSGFPDFNPSDPINRQLRSGQRTLLMYLRNYNGKANDTDVGVTFIGSGGLYTDVGCDGLPRDAGPPLGFPDDAGQPGLRFAPVWDGCDRWSPNPGQVLGLYPDRTPPTVTDAYVADYTVVVSIKEVTLPLFGGSTKAGNAFAVARLIPEGASFRVEGVIAGRMAFSELIEVIGRTEVDEGATRKPLCETAFWPTVGPTLCAARDTMESPSLDHTGATCNAATATFGFTARPAQVSDTDFANLMRTSSCNAAVVTCK